MSLISPCKGCPERFLACAGNCPKDARGEYGYLAWKAELLAQQMYLESHKYRFNVPWSASHEKTPKPYTKFGKDGFKRGGNQ